VVWRLRSPDGEFKQGKAFPEEMLRRVFSTNYRDSRFRQWSTDLALEGLESTAA